MMGVQNVRTSRALTEFLASRVVPGEDACRSLWRWRGEHRRNRVSGSTRRFAAEAITRVVDQYPCAVRIAALRLGVCPLPMVRQTLTPRGTRRHSPPIPSPLAHRLPVALCGDGPEADYRYPQQRLARQCGRFQSV